ncbi:MAG TPA: DNA-binding domain-containing protein, partial [Steroidobacteraceae bacterium]|nr:DNA-binding domain-containing protein [Steroidobacteraceae bacterium]
GAPMTTATLSLSQRDFAQALLDGQQQCPAGLRSWNGSDPAARFAVHRNNVVSSLVAALADTFPVTRQLVGEAFFPGMARQFVTCTPPRSPVLALYGEGFPAFVQRFEPVRRLPYLADVARLEVLRVRAFHAADAPVLSADDIARHLLDPQALPGARVEFHPSASMLASRFAIVALWAAHQGVGEIAGVDPAQPQSALVLRQQDDVAIIPVERSSAGFFTRLLAGATLGEAGAAAESDEGFNLAVSLGVLIRHRALSAWHPSRSRCP